MEYHEVAAIFPMMNDEQYADLKADIKANGLREEIWTHEGKIVDGRNRWRACDELGIKPKLRAWDGKGSLVAFVASLNLHRRHLTSGQRAMIAEKMLPMLEVEGKRIMQEAGRKGGQASSRSQTPLADKGLQKVANPSEPFDAHLQAAKIAGTNRRYVQDAKLIRQRDPELAAKVEKGEVPFREAVKTVAKPLTAKPRNGNTTPASPAPNGKPSGKPGVGVDRANEAINALKRIPLNDPLRNRGFQIVSDWIKANR